MTAHMLEVSLLGVRAVLRLERDPCVVNGQMTKASNNWVPPPPPRPQVCAMDTVLDSLVNIFTNGRPASGWHVLPFDLVQT